MSNMLMMKGFPNLYDDLDSFPSVLGNIIENDSILEIQNNSDIVNLTEEDKTEQENYDKDKKEFRDISESDYKNKDDDTLNSDIFENDHCKNTKNCNKNGLVNIINDEIRIVEKIEGYSFS